MSGNGLCVSVIMAKWGRGDNYRTRNYHKSGFEYFARCLYVCGYIFVSVIANLYGKYKDGRGLTHEVLSSKVVITSKYSWVGIGIMAGVIQFQDGL